MQNVTYKAKKNKKKSKKKAKKHRHIFDDLWVNSFFEAYLYHISDTTIGSFGCSFKVHFIMISCCKEIYFNFQMSYDIYITIKFN
jgi:hypothetical protein